MRQSITPAPDLSLHRRQISSLQRRGFLRGSLSLGGLMMLSGCNLEDDDAVDRALRAMSRWNDRVQAALFSSHRLAREYPRAAITDPFPFNAYYPIDRVPRIDGATWRLELGGRIDNRTSWSIADLRALPQVAQVTKHICIEGWSAIGEWGGVRMVDFLTRIGADLRAPYIGLRCADNYTGHLDMASALHPQTLLALDFRGEPLPPAYGFPLKVRVPTKLGFKSPKHVIALDVLRSNPGGFWEAYGYNGFSGL